VIVHNVITGETFYSPGKLSMAEYIEKRERALDMLARSLEDGSAITEAAVATGRVKLVWRRVAWFRIGEPLANPPPRDKTPLPLP